MRERICGKGSGRTKTFFAGHLQRKNRVRARRKWQRVDLENMYKAGLSFHT